MDETQTLESNVESEPSKDYESKTERQLLKLEDMPQHLQFNPHIRSGYRPLMGPLDCVKSIFSLHNETVNILTHGELDANILDTLNKNLTLGPKYS